MMAAAVFFILFVPFALVPYLPAAALAGNLSFPILLGIQLATIALIVAATAVQCRLGVFENPAYALASPLSGALISLGFLSAIADARKKGVVNWRDRQYTVRESQHPIH